VQGAVVTMTATVTSAVTTATSTPTGTVQFAIDGNFAGTGVALSTAGIATFNLPTGSLSVGVHNVKAVYTGDATYMGSQAVFRVTVTAATAPDFTLTPATATVTVKSGAIAPPVQFNVNAVNGFNGTVTFNASYLGILNAPQSFSVNPVTVPGSTMLELFAYTNNAQSRQVGTVRRYGAGPGVVLAGMLILMMSRRRRLLSGVLAVVLSVVLVSASGCAIPPLPVAPTTTPTAPGTYTVTVSATGTVSGASVTHSAVVTLVIQ
jgi:hypothetical protein